MPEISTGPPFKAFPPSRPCAGAINQSAGSPATHTGKRTQCLRFFSVTPRRDEDYEIAVLPLGVPGGAHRAAF